MTNHRKQLMFMRAGRRLHPFIMLALDTYGAASRKYGYGSEQSSAALDRYCILSDQDKAYHEASKKFRSRPLPMREPDLTRKFPV